MAAQDVLFDVAEQQMLRLYLTARAFVAQVLRPLVGGYKILHHCRVCAAERHDGKFVHVAVVVVFGSFHLPRFGIVQPAGHVVQFMVAGWRAHP